MMNLSEWLNMHLMGQKNKIFSVLVALCSSILIYTIKFQRNYFSKTYLAVSILIFIVVFFLVDWLNRWVIGKLIQRRSKDDIRLCAWLAVPVSLLLLMNFSPIPLYSLEKDETFTIRPVQNETAVTAPIGLLYVRNNLGYIPYADLNISGDWVEEPRRLVLNEFTSLSWRGDITDYLEIGFEPASDLQKVSILVDGVEYVIDLQRSAGGDVVAFFKEGKTSFLSEIPYILSFLLLTSYLLFILFCFLASDHLRRFGKPLAREKIYWLGVPFLITCLFTLLVFWPGMMSNDSIGQWKQAVTLNMNDWHPIFHTFLISQLIRIVYSPAIVVILQVVILWAVFMRGMSILQKYGVPEWVLWTIAFIFAFFPPNLVLPITLWKDIGYSIALLGLFFVVLRIALSSGEWLSKKKGWIVLGLTAFSVAIFRQNGLVVAILTILVILFFFRRYKKELFLSLLISLTAWGGVREILNWQYNHESGRPSQINIILLPHLAAHIEAGTAMNEDERTYLNGLMPLSKWDYDCCYIGNISYNPSFDRQTYLQNLPTNLKIALDFFVRNPLVDFRHQKCASEVVWALSKNQCALKSVQAFNDINSGKVSWVLANSYGVEDKSLIPAMIPLYMDIFQKVGMLSGYPRLLIRPAFYLFLSLIMIAAAGLKRRKLLLLFVPVLLQAISMALIIFSPCYRYQYGICLIGIVSLGLPFLSVEKEDL